MGKKGKQFISVLMILALLLGIFRRCEIFSVNLDLL